MFSLTICACIVKIFMHVKFHSWGILLTKLHKNLLMINHAMFQGYAKAGADVPLGRTALVEDVAQAIVYLASAASSFITGTLLPVDGGYNLLTPGASSLHHKK